MGGKSDGFMLLKESQNQEFDFISAKGNVSTDGGGFLMFRKEIDNNSSKRALIIGAGGVSPSVVLSIKKSGKDIVLLIM